MSLVILDRDGVINHDSDDYIKSPDEWQPLPGSLEAIARLCRADYTVVVATNQAGVGRGLFSQEMLIRIHRKMASSIRDKGGRLDSVFFCPHSPAEQCGCRKPKPGMLLEISDRLGIGLSGVPVVGDSLRDLEAAEAAGAIPVLVKTGRGRLTQEKLSKGDLSHTLGQTPVYADLAAFTDAVLDGRLESVARHTDQGTHH
ncbi:MAG TPA: D-glycero-beta-D-manno-heptose 1,7-bisphosphate 7-phosphatase [Gammaproteobacteria bacterium]|nr:D-glycero-beta-D-manno-heptose 1,7-bisphosphate 7-phosphatase [Arenicellales bacterium]HIF79557.1 D-glycero-beta-D-manno-heptose 1,7-bisphosphate 7-phosphatase [Gammaproteobacteria bacterium]HIM05947.1 D-glycero-beta-D-manno-heptose 1,7-bisphosphate 7-phosphatase [Gammaproteobacteria bacterium]